MIMYEILMGSVTRRQGACVIFLANEVVELVKVSSACRACVLCQPLRQPRSLSE